VDLLGIASTYIVVSAMHITHSDILFFWLTWPVVPIGSQDGKLHFWDVPGLKKVAIIDSPHTDVTQAVVFNPKYLIMASADSQLVSIQSWLRREMVGREEQRQSNHKSMITFPNSTSIKWNAFGTCRVGLFRIEH
jgi:WD40 repeat protein